MYKDSSASQGPDELTSGKIRTCSSLEKVDYVDSNPLLNINDNQSRKEYSQSVFSYKPLLIFSKIKKNKEWFYDFF